MKAVAITFAIVGPHGSVVGCCVRGWWWRGDGLAERDGDGDIDGDGFADGGRVGESGGLRLPGGGGRRSVFRLAW